MGDNTGYYLKIMSLIIAWFGGILVIFATVVNHTTTITYLAAEGYLTTRDPVLAYWVQGLLTQIYLLTGAGITAGSLIIGGTFISLYKNALIGGLICIICGASSHFLWDWLGGILGFIAGVVSILAYLRKD